jgi:hypothetical protein
MADIGLIRAQLTGIADEKTRRILITVFEYLLGTVAFGEPDHQARATNFQMYYENSTTASTAATEFSIAHGLSDAPHLAIPVLDLTAAGSQWVPLTVSRVADSKRIYLTSSSTRAPIALLVE